MNLKVKTDLCDQCGTCISVCPKDALLLIENLLIDQSRCILCKNCVSVCPVAALTISEDLK
jgi:ferredoxin